MYAVTIMNDAQALVCWQSPIHTSTSSRLDATLAFILDLHFISPIATLLLALFGSPPTSSIQWLLSELFLL